MTDPSIPPCPVCGLIPEFEGVYGRTNCDCLCPRWEDIAIFTWVGLCDGYLINALRTHGVHTIQQLTERLNDPRVAPIFWTPIPPTSEMVPGKDVLLMCQNGSGKTYVVIGCWIPQYWDEVCDEDNSEYCEEKDEYFCPAGWYEQIQNWDEYGSVAIADKVTHYMPIPELIAAQRGEG